MDTIGLTPIERSALLILMAESRPLKESAELMAVHGITLKPAHRKKLQGLGLIKTTKKPSLTHELTEKGWRWAKNELSANRPKGQMGMGALYAVLNGLRKHIERQGCALEDVFQLGGISHGTSDRIGRQHLENAAWTEADEALAQALQDMSIFNRELGRLKNSAQGDLSKQVERTAKASNLVLQSVRQAARRRELRFAAEEGTEAAFDPVMHRSDERLAVGKAVRIRKAPVVRGPSNLGLVVLMGEVDPV
jgi:hypothetical protein